MAKTEGSSVPPPAPGVALGRAVGAGLICGFLAVIQSAGFGLLLFGGGTHALSPVAMSMALYATAAATVIAVFTGSFPGTVSITQTVPIAALAGGVSPLLAATGGAEGTAASAATLEVPTVSASNCVN